MEPMHFVCTKVVLSYHILLSSINVVDNEIATHLDKNQLAAIQLNKFHFNNSDPCCFILTPPDPFSCANLQKRILFEFMAFYGYHGDADKWTTTTYDPSYYYDPTTTHFQSDYQYGESHFVTDHNSPASYTDYWLEPPSEQGYSLFDYSEPIAYHHSPYNYYTDPSGIKYSEPVEYHHPSNNSYNYYTDLSETKYCEPKLLQYHPSSYSTHYFPTDTTFTISYATTSTQEFNEPEFEEYDPTPYGGGYDPDTTYGRPLPPSDIICYPRKLPQSDSGTSPEVFSYSSVPSPYGNNDDDPPIKAPVVEKEEEDVPIKAPAVEKQDDDLPIEAEDEGSRDFEIVGSPEENPTASESPFYESGYRAEYFYGSGLESMDLCDALFGYWPCLAKREERLRRKKEEIYEEERRLDPWNKCAEYFFGGPCLDYNNSKAQHLQYQ